MFICTEMCTCVSGLEKGPLCFLQGNMIINLLLATKLKEVMFLPKCVCVCLSVIGINQKVMNVFFFMKLAVNDHHLNIPFEFYFEVAQ